MQSQKSFTERLRKVEGSRQVAQELNLAKQVVKDNSTKYNELHSECLLKAGKLKELEVVLAGLDPDEMGGRRRIETQAQLEAELEETLQGLRNETHYQETLEGMLENRKISLREKKKPITYLKMDIGELDQELSLIHKETLKAEKALASSLKDLKVCDDLLQRQKDEHAEQLELELTQYKDKQKLLLFLKKEQEESAKNKRQVDLQARIHDLERELTHAQGEA